MNIYGQLVDQIYAPAGGVVVGRSTNLVAETGARVLHLGVPGSTFPSGAMDDGHMYMFPVDDWSCWTCTAETMHVIYAGAGRVCGH